MARSKRTSATFPQGTTINVDAKRVSEILTQSSGLPVPQWFAIQTALKFFIENHEVDSAVPRDYNLLQQKEPTNGTSSETKKERGILASVVDRPRGRKESKKSGR